MTEQVHLGRGVTIPVEETRLRENPERSVRIDVFFSRAPHRFSLSAAESTRFFVQDQPIYLRKPDIIAWAFQKVRSYTSALHRIGVFPLSLLEAPAWHSNVILSWKRGRMGCVEKATQPHTTHQKYETTSIIPNSYINNVCASGTILR